MKVMIVEDNPDMRQMIRRMVSDIADEINECSSGAEAITLYPKLKPDWVLMDVEMENVNGITAVRWIKADFPEAKILVITNYDDEIIRTTAEQAGASGYVLKDNLLEVRSILSASANSTTQENMV